MKKNLFLFLSFGIISNLSLAQSLNFQGQKFSLKNVVAEVVDFHGEKVLKVERDLKAIPFDLQNLEHTVDEPTFVELDDLNFENGIIEVKMLSQIQNPSPFAQAQGFIGLAFRITEGEKAYESIYLRPKVGRSDNQYARNHTVQYYSYPEYKFDTLRKLSLGKYETTAPVDINEWIKFKLIVKDKKAELFINDALYSTMIVDNLLGEMTKGKIGLWVDIATIGYFKDLKVEGF